MVALITAVFFALVFLLTTTPAYAKSFGAKMCESPHYTCYTTKSGDSWQKLFPDELQRDIVMRINRMNTKLYRGLTIAIPNQFGESHLKHSPFPQQTDPTGQRFIVVSLSNLAFGAYEANGELLHWGPISGGRNYCSDVGRGGR